MIFIIIVFSILFKQLGRYFNISDYVMIPAFLVTVLVIFSISRKKIRH